MKWDSIVKKVKSTAAALWRRFRGPIIGLVTGFAAALALFASRKPAPAAKPLTPAQQKKRAEEEVSAAGKEAYANEKKKVVDGGPTGAMDNLSPDGRSALERERESIVGDAVASARKRSRAHSPDGGGTAANH